MENETNARNDGCEYRHNGCPLYGFATRVYTEREGEDIVHPLDSDWVHKVCEQDSGRCHPTGLTELIKSEIEQNKKRFSDLIVKTAHSERINSSMN